MVKNMDIEMKKIIALFLVFSMLALAGNLYAKEKRGAKLIIQKKDGQQVSGELIAVKEDSLLLLSKSGRDETVNIQNIHFIKIAKKSKAIIGILIGGLVGLAVVLPFKNYDLTGRGPVSDEDYKKAVRQTLAYSRTVHLKWILNASLTSFCISQTSFL